MVLEDVQLLNILKGKRIKVTLKTSSYFGVVQRINPNKTLILSHVVRCSDGCEVPGSKMFFGREILNVESASEAKSDGNIQDHRLEGQLNVEEFQPYKKKITLGDDEDEEENINFVVIDEFHEKFGPAVMDIKKQHVIGVGAAPVEMFQNGRLCWLQIATKHKVYLFDILLLGTHAFKNGLSMILGNKHILKVIHDCRAIAGCLIAQFRVKLTNVFDTQVADIMCFYSDTGGFLPDRVSTLQEVVSLHLKVPSSQLLSLQMKSELTKQEREVWQKRPCPLPLLNLMALSVIHLQPLRQVLLDTLMIDYTALVDAYLSSSYYEIGELDHSGMSLPRELQQLEQMRHERRERAADHYPVTEQGLLARFNPRTQPPAETSPAAQEHNQKQEDFLEPATVESPSPTQVDPVVHKPPVSPLRVTNVSSVDVHVSPDPAVQPPAAVTDLRKEMSNSPPSQGVGRGRTEVPMGTVGRGRPFGKEQSILPLPTIGRGFLLQISQAQFSRESAADQWPQC